MLLGSISRYYLRVHHYPNGETIEDFFAKHVLSRWTQRFKHNAGDCFDSHLIFTQQVPQDLLSSFLDNKQVIVATQESVGCRNPHCSIDTRRNILPFQIEEYSKLMLTYGILSDVRFKPGRHPILDAYFARKKMEIKELYIAQIPSIHTTAFLAVV